MITETAVAGYLAKYATKAAEATGHSSARLTNATVRRYATLDTHAGRLVDACWRLGRPGSDLDPEPKPPRTPDACPTAASNAGPTCSASAATSPPNPASTPPPSKHSAKHAATGDANDTAPPNTPHDTETTLIVGNFTYANTGWRTIGDALLANTAAAKAREHRQLIKDLIAESNDH